MSKIALMTVFDREDSGLSLHFGKAKWMMIRDMEQAATKFIQNHGLNGKSVVEELLREQCTDVICSEIGAGALENLKRAHIQGWLAPVSLPAPRLFEMFAAGSLQPVSAIRQHGESGGCCHVGDNDREAHTAGGCGCQHRSGDGHAKGCCAG